MKYILYIPSVVLGYLLNDQKIQSLEIIMTMSDSFPIIRKSDLSQVSVPPNLDYENAIWNWEEAGEDGEAARVRKLQAEMVQ